MNCSGRRGQQLELRASGAGGAARHNAPRPASAQSRHSRSEFCVWAPSRARLFLVLVPKAADGTQRARKRRLAMVEGGGERERQRAHPDASNTSDCRPYHSSSDRAAHFFKKRKEREICRLKRPLAFAKSNSRAGWQNTSRLNWANRPRLRRTLIDHCLRIAGRRGQAYHASKRLCAPLRLEDTCCDRTGERSDW